MRGGEPSGGHKLSISLKELGESRVWIRLIIKADLLDECSQLCNIIAQSIVTAKSNAATPA
jgi:hypothetical protein